MKCEEEEKDRIEQLKKWLDKNTIVISEPKEVTLYGFNVNWSGRRDLNPRPLDPQSSALPGCATPRLV